jgi:hypothetical protein
VLRYVVAEGTLESQAFPLQLMACAL